MSSLKKMESKLKEVGFVKQVHKQSKSNIYVKSNNNESDIVVVVIKGRYPGDVSIKFGLRLKKIENLIDEYELSEMRRMGFDSPEIFFAPTVYSIEYEGAGKLFNEEEFFEKNGAKLNGEEYSHSLIESYFNAIRNCSSIDGVETKGSFYFFKRRLCLLFENINLDEDEVEKGILSNNLVPYREDILKFSRWLRNKIFN